MKHQYIVTAKTRARRQFPGTTLREVQMIEDLYGHTHIKFEPTDFLVYNNIDNPTYYAGFKRGDPTPRMMFKRLG